MQYVVEELVLFVPQRDPFSRDVIERLGNVEEVLEKFGGDVLVRAVLPRYFQSDHEHVQAVHAHPGGPIRLLKVSTGGQRRAAVENTNVVQPQETALKHIVPLAVLAVHPPGEVKQELVEDPLQEVAVGLPGGALLDFIDTPCRPGMDGRIYIPEGPF